MLVLHLHQMQFVPFVHAYCDISLLAYPDSLALAGISQVILLTQDGVQLVSLHVKDVASI